MFQPVNIRRYLALMMQRDFAEELVLEGTGIRIDRLHDPAYLIDLEQSRSVVTNMIRLSGDPTLGLAFGRLARISDFGIVGHALLSSKSIRQATALWLQYSRSSVDVMVRFKLEEHEGCGWSMRILDAFTGSTPVYRFCADELLVFGHKLVSLLTREPTQVARLRLSYASMGNQAQYRAVFGCEPEFDTPHTEIVINSPGLDDPLRVDPEELSEVCLRHCSNVMRQSSDAKPDVSRLRSMLLRMGGEPPNIAEAARQLHISERTLRRRLLSAGVSYQSLLDEFRCDMATEYLRSGRIKPKEVAYLLGFKSAGTFRRAFKSWTGTTIGDFLSAEPARKGHSSRTEAII